MRQVPKVPVIREKEAETPNEFDAKFGVRTDLAIEAHEVIVEREGPPELPGVTVDTRKEGDILISRVVIESDVGARLMGKMKGTYSTIESSALRDRDQQAQENVTELLAKEIEWFLERMGIAPDDNILVVGLGNWNATPDALGPRVVGHLMVTRHLYEMSPPEVRGGLRPVCAISPGVLGITGIETGEIVKGLVDKVGPKLVICVDALASRSTQRVCSTIQLADTGINPGSGVGNKRVGITKDSLGVSVLAVGVPTVIYASTIISDGMDLLMSPPENGEVRESIAEELPKRTVLRPSIDAMRAGLQNGGANGNGAEQNRRGTRLPETLPIDPAQKRMVIHQVLAPYMGNMIVTPKEIDVLIEDIAQVVANGLNAALHKSLDLNNVLQYLQ